MNPIVNSAFVWNVPAIVAPSAIPSYVCEGWMVTVGTVGQAIAGLATSTPLPQSQSALSFGRALASSVTTPIAIGTAIQSLDTAQFVGYVLACSFDLSFGSGFASQGPLTAQLVASTGVNQPVSGLSGGTVIGTGTFAYSASGARVTFSTSSPVPSYASQLSLVLSYTPTGSANPVNPEVVTISRVQFDTTAQQSYRPVPYVMEKLRCLEYYEEIDIQSGTYLGLGSLYANSYAIYDIEYSNKRIVPTIGISPIGNVSIFDFVASGSHASTAIGLLYARTHGADLISTVAGAPYTTSNGAGCAAQATGPVVITINARL
jgi:hypothetical protein